EIWARETGNQPLRIVTGDTWSAGIIGVTASTLPSAFTDGSFSEAPWITLRRVDQEGMLIVWQPGRLPPAMRILIAGRVVRHEEFVARPRRCNRLIVVAGRMVRCEEFVARPQKGKRLILEYIVVGREDADANSLAY